jgi:SulP family sulfate permease
VIIYRISGAFFFGAAATVAAALDRIGEYPKAYVIDFSAVPLIDSTAAATIEGFMRKAQRQNAALYITGASAAIREVLTAQGIGSPHARFMATVAEALAHRHARGEVGQR